MAYHQARSRDPLIDSSMQETLEKRSVELLGLVLIVMGISLTLVFWTYSPLDRSFWSVSDQPIQNALGVTGASIAAPFMLILGKASWSIVGVFFGWGVRFLTHIGAERAVTRILFAPVAFAIASTFTATLIPDQGWTHGFGMGGLFGETAVGYLITILPLSSAFAINALTLICALATLGIGAFVLGFSKDEIKYILRFMWVGSVLTYSKIRVLLGASAHHALSFVNEKRSRSVPQDHSDIRFHSETHSDFVRREPQFTAHPDAQQDTYITTQPHDFLADEMQVPAKKGLFSKIPSFGRKQLVLPEQELVSYAPNVSEIDAPGEDRIRTKISQVIRSRNAPQINHSEPSETHRLAQSMEHVSAQTNFEQCIEPTLSTLENVDDVSLIDDVFDEGDAQIASVPPYTHPQELQSAIPRYEPKKVVQQQSIRPIRQSKQARAEAQPALMFEDSTATFDLPPLNLLTNPEQIERMHLSDEALEENARLLEAVLDDYGIKGEIVSVRPGPVVTMYELEPAPGLKASRVIGLADDIARSMSALAARVSTVPGRSVIGIELPNEHREKVVLREILSSRAFGDGNQKLPLALGKDIGGEPIVANLAKMPHLLIAGTTGSGKSVAINTMILSLLYKLSPEECRLIMIDPKMLELSVYDGIPHLLSPVVTDPKKAVVALKWVVGEMEERYRKMSKMGVRNIDGYNSRVQDALSKNEMFSRTIQTGFDDETGDPVFETEEFQPEKMPYIVVIVDEMADLMMVAGKEIEACIQRLAQMARASGIHLIMATQRPSVDVITGTVKANFPTRISFQVTSKIDSRTILGEMGAEQLLGMGDMLYMAGGSKIIRCHGPFVSDEEVEEIVNHLKAYGPPEYMSGVIDGPSDDKADSIDLVLGLGGNTDGEDAIYDQAVQIVLQDRKCSTSYIQRKLAIGYNKAARLVEQMEDQGLVSPANHVGKREILVPEQ